MNEWDVVWAERVVRLISRLRSRGVDEAELVECEVAVVRILGVKR